MRVILLNLKRCYCDCKPPGISDFHTEMSVTNSRQSKQTWWSQPLISLYFIEKGIWRCVYPWTLWDYRVHAFNDGSFFFMCTWYKPSVLLWESCLLVSRLCLDLQVVWEVRLLWCYFWEKGVIVEARSLANPSGHWQTLSNSWISFCSIVHWLQVWL
jgi:hypothetical protein